MPRMTEAEAWALENEVTRNSPKVDPAKARHPVRMIAVDDFSADWLRIKAEADHTTPGEIIGELVRERIAVTVWRENSGHAAVPGTMLLRSEGEYKPGNAVVTRGTQNAKVYQCLLVHLGG